MIEQNIGVGVFVVGVVGFAVLLALSLSPLALAPAFVLTVAGLALLND